MLHIKLPPLRERSEDIPLLCQHFIDKFNIRLEKDIRGIAPAAMSLLLKHQWPGNVRELENVIERAAVLSEEIILQPDNFPIEPVIPSESEILDGIIEGYSLKTAQKNLEKNLITRALEATGGNRTKAARLLEISHPSLLSKIKIYNILM